MPASADLLSYYNLLLLLRGFATTLILSFVAGVAGFGVGFLLAVVRQTSAKAMAPIRAAALAYGLLLRRVPFLVTLMLVFFASQASGSNLPILVVALLSVSLIAAAYLAEAVRGGMLAVPASQWDSAATMNFSYSQTLRFVILPQAWRFMVPPTFAFLVSFIKDTALVSQLGVVELTSAGKILQDKGHSAGAVYGIILLLYFAISYPLTRFGKRLERGLAQDRIR